MIPLLLALVAPAHAQYSEFSPEDARCGDPNPISGTAGVRNAGEAIQANANTYSASNFAHNQLNSLDADNYWGDGDLKLGVAVDLNVTYGAADMVVYHPRHLQYPDQCVAKYRVATKGLDLLAANTGFVIKGGPLGAFYATSFTWAAPAYGDQFTRVLMTSFVSPAYVLVASATAGPLDLLTSGDLEATNEFSSIKLEWMGGATFELDKVHASAAYLSSGGAYLQASEEIVGSYFFAAVKPGGNTVFQGGIDRLDPEELLDMAGGVGLTSVAYQQLPFFLAGADQANAGPGLLEQLRVGRVHQQNIGGTFDINARNRIQPSPSVSELSIGMHTVDFHMPRSGRDSSAGDLLFLLQGGMVTTPAAWAQGNGPATLGSGRMSIGGRYSDADLFFSIYLNDPDQLQLYPFARNAVSYQLWLASAAL
jgi:hypothetical protein